MGLTIGVDVGGTKVAVGAVDEQGHIIEKLKRSTPSTSPEQTAQVVGEISRSPAPARGERQAGTQH